MKFINTFGKRLAAAAAVATVGTIGIVAVSQAAVKPDCKNLMYPLCARSVAATQVVDNSLPGYKKLAPGSVSEDRLSTSVQDKLNKTTTDTDENGKAGQLWALKGDPKPIDKIGGSFSTGATTIDTFVLPKGTWLLNLNVKFNRPAAAADATDPEVQPMVQLLADGNEYSTIMGNDIGNNAGADLTGSAVRLVTVRADTTITVKAFGYNEARSSVGSGLINVESASVVAVHAG